MVRHYIYSCGDDSVISAKTKDRESERERVCSNNARPLVLQCGACTLLACWFPYLSGYISSWRRSPYTFFIRHFLKITHQVKLINTHTQSQPLTYVCVCATECKPDISTCLRSVSDQSHSPDTTILLLVR